MINKRFSHSFYGYDMREVDEFLDELIRDIDALYKAKELDTVRIRTLLTELDKRSVQAGRPAAAENTEAKLDAAKNT